MKRNFWELAKWHQTFKISLARHLAYKLNLLLLFVLPSVVFFLIKYNLWVSIFTLGNHEVIQGYSLSRMLEYQAWVLIVGLLGQGYINHNLSEDIRLGRISSYLLYPFDFWKYHTAAFLAFQSIEVCICLVTLVAIALSGVVAFHGVLELLVGFFLVLLVGFLWFLLQFTLGLIAFWLEETWVLRVMLVTVAQFFSGAIIPLELFPEVLQTGLKYTLFPYLTAVPVQVFMGTNKISAALAILVTIIWIIIVALAAVGIWKIGIKQYRAAGI